MHLVMIGGSDAGISAALRARELEPGADVTVVLEDAYPNFSICGIPYWVSGEVAHWRNLAHRTIADLEAAGMRLRLDTTARRIDVPGRKLAITSPDGNLPDVYAAGDCVITHHRLLGVTYLPLGTTAHKQGRVAGENALGGNRAFAGSLGTQVVKIFDQAAARTGLRDHEAKVAGFDPVTVESAADDHKAYYPGSHRITMRITGDRATGRLLGLQLFGHKHAEIAKRIDIAATAIYSGMTVDAVSDLDLSYTPPLGSPWEAVQMAAQAWLRHTQRPLDRPRSSSRGTPMSGHHTPMSGHHTRQGLRPRRSTYPVIAAAAAIIVLAVGACSNSTTTSTATSAVAVASNGPGGQKPTLTGAGSTFDAPFFAVAFARYQQLHPGVTIGYSAVGSSAGIAAISAQQVNFGAADVPMTAAEQAAAKGGPITQVPVDLGGEGIAYHLSLPAGARLHLTGPVLAEIFLGQITHWNDPAITALNPGITLPPATINVVHRSDGSGTTYIFSNYLSSVDPAWASKVGTGKTLNWPTGEGAEGNGGVATDVYRTPFSIGYIEEAYSQGLLLPFAAIRNQAGNYVTPSTQTVAADAVQKPAITPTDFSIVNEPGATSYPISGYSWALVYTRQPSQATGQTLVATLDWLTHDGQAYAAANGYVPLPPQIQQLARTMLQQVTGPNGTHLLS
jgi:phosphate transport system substrate-binding protein